MVASQTEPRIDPATAERLSAEFAAVFETFDAGDLFTDDVFFDLNMPVWRFQLQGGAAFARQLESINRGPNHVRVLRTVATASGFVAEHEEHETVDGHDFFARRVWLCDVQGGRIFAATGYCSGEWDEELKARHAAEAPMLRDW